MKRSYFPYQSISFHDHYLEIYINFLRFIESNFDISHMFEAKSAQNIAFYCLLLDSFMCIIFLCDIMQSTQKY